MLSVRLRFGLQIIPFGIFTLLVVMLSVRLRLGLQLTPKGVICSPNRRRTDNITTKSVKIPKGLSIVRIEDGLVVMLSVRLRFGLQIIPFGIFTLLVVMLSVLLRFGLQITPMVSSHFWSLCCLSVFDSD
jgi:accessory gene regulator protein AgrB